MMKKITAGTLMPLMKLPSKHIMNAMAHYVAGQLSKAESMTLEIASMRSVVKTEYCISQNWLREQVIRGYYGGYGGLVQPPPFYEGLHLEVKTAIEKALLLVDFDAVKQGKKFEINIYY